MQKCAAKFHVYEGLCCKDKIGELKKVCVLNKNSFQKVKSQADSIVKDSYVVAYLIAKNSKPFTEDEFRKQCIESVADIICPETRGIFVKSVHLTD